MFVRGFFHNTLLQLATLLDILLQLPSQSRSTTGSVEMFEGGKSGKNTKNLHTISLKIEGYSEHKGLFSYTLSM